MANGTVRGKSWGGLHGRLPSTDWPLKCRLEHGIPFDREAPGRQERQSARHQRGRKETFGQPGRHQGGRKGSIGQPGRHQGGRKGSIGQPARHQGGRKEPFGQPGRHQGGTRETCSTGLPIESRFWKGAGFCLTFNTISMANGPVRGKSWGGAPRPAAQHRLAFEMALGAQDSF